MEALFTNDAIVLVSLEAMHVLAADVDGTPMGKNHN